MTFCVLGAQCSVFDRREKLAGLAVGAALCEGCRLRTQSELRMLRLDYVDLSQLVPQSSRTSAQVLISRPKPESRPPIDMGIFGLRSQIAWTVLLAERVLRQAQGEIGRYAATPVREGYALDRAVRYLGTRVDELAALAPCRAYWDASREVRLELDGAQVVALLGALHRSARRACGLAEPVICLPGDCPVCSASSLRRTDAQPGTVWCQHCKTTLTGSDYLRHVSLSGPVTQPASATLAKPGDNTCAT